MPGIQEGVHQDKEPEEQLVMGWECQGEKDSGTD